MTYSIRGGRRRTPNKEFDASMAARRALHGKPKPKGAPEEEDDRKMFPEEEIGFNKKASRYFNYKTGRFVKTADGERITRKKYKTK